MSEIHHANPFLKKRYSPLDFPPKFMEVWEYFKTLDKEDPKELGLDFSLSGLVFEKIYSPTAGFWLITCRAKRLSNTTSVLAYVKVEGESVQYKTPNDNHWTTLPDTNTFVDRLLDLIDDPANQRQFFIMQQENNKSFFMGFFHADEPYEIDYRSVKFSVSADQCDILLMQKDKTLKDLDPIDATIINNVYPQTSTSIGNDVSKYKFITFNGFLYTPVEIIPGEGGLFSFRAKFVRDMKM
ncbi:hypothetical protein IKQ19_04640 [Candidatus Saccharibacteria bacterium]|nr:hypothetical protein [Candidatus Saccharibacteria bacterium]